mmetsp:Transcript_14174/g.20947  ORF Transcript_14174/g.20947 Transcript_14174/m.20947 type:complete len:626 (+) Transcript_14174:156-2033(+)
MLEYDDSAFYYFSLTLVTFYIIPVTFGLLYQIFWLILPHNDTSSIARTSDERRKAEMIRKEKKSAALLFKSRAFLVKVVTIVIGWGLIIALVKKMSSDSVGLAQFDPYAILGIEPGVEDKAIKTAYRNLAKEYHPDKNPGNKMAEDMFMKIAKAYEALTNAQSRENWELYGNPDGKQPMAVSIALPTFLLDKSYHNSILIVYLLAMVIVIPSFVAMWYARSKKFGENDVMYDTYTWYNHMLSEESQVIKMAEVLAGSAEFRALNKPHKNEEKEIKKIYLEMLKGPKEEIVLQKLRYEHPIIMKGVVLLISHLTRRDIDPKLQKDLKKMLLKSPELIEAMVELTVSRRWLFTTMAIIDFSQRLVQGLWTKTNNLMQLPHVTNFEVKSIAAGKDAPKSLSAFLARESKAMEQAEGGQVEEDGKPLVPIKSCFAKMSEEKQRDIRAAIKAIPQVTMNVMTFVEDEEEIAEGDMVTIKVTITRNNLKEGEKCPPVYAPHFPSAREEGWWVLLASMRNKQVLSYGHVISTGKVTTKEIKLLAPSQPTTVQLDLFFKSDSYIGLDQKLEVKFDVISSATLPEYKPHPDDLELDNEPTLFEQVMQGYNDSDSDDDAKEVKKQEAKESSSDEE